MEEEPSLVEARCAELARQRQFIQDVGVQVLPNGEAFSRFSFIHALYRKVLYERLSESRRVQLHRRIGERGEVVYGARVKEIAGELAMHFERAADPQQAAKYLQQAADNAIRRFAYREAVGLSRRGLDLLSRLPDTPARAWQELCLQLTLGVPLIATEGYAAADVGNAYLRARELCRQLGETPDLSEALWGLWTFHTLRAELGTAREIAEEMLRLAERFPAPGLSMRAHLAMEITFLHMGNFAPAIEHFEKAFSLYDPERHLEDAFNYAQNPGLVMRCFAAWALWFLGRSDQSLAQMQEALTLARALVEPHGLAHAHLFVAFLHQYRREERMAQVHAEAALAISNEHGLAMYQAMATVLRGWVLLYQGRHEVAIEQMRHGLDALQITGTELLRPHFLGLLAEALGKAGQTEEAVRTLEEALAIVQANGEGAYEAELYRLKGELLLIQAARPGFSRADDALVAAQAEACFYHAIRTAQAQEAKSWELRAVMSMARLYQSQNRQNEARNLLTPIYTSFTEGLATADLRDAKVLIEELSESQTSHKASSN
jgi:predicted ATPase